MSLTSLRSFSDAASLATTAFDTARTTLKAMAEVAVPPPGSQAAPTDQPSGRGTPAPVAAAVAKSEATERAPGEKPKGIRKGTVLDAYA